MGKHAQLVMGPAGCGKSTYCTTLQRHCDAAKRSVHVVNLDPAAERFEYQPSIDIRQLVTLEDAMASQGMGPNGGLIFCMEFLGQHMDWLEDALGEFEDDYLIIDCPGQIELYSHLSVMQDVVKAMQSWGYAVCSVYMLDAQFALDPAKFISGMLSCLSAMIPHINVLGKMDLIEDKTYIDDLLDPSVEELVGALTGRMGTSRERLNRAIGELVAEYSMVSFLPLDITEEDSVGSVLLAVDMAIQYGEDREPAEPRDEDEPPD